MSARRGSRPVSSTPKITVLLRLARTQSPFLALPRTKSGAYEPLKIWITNKDAAHCGGFQQRGSGGCDSLEGENLNCHPPNCHTPSDSVFATKRSAIISTIVLLFVASHPGVLKVGRRETGWSRCGRKLPTGSTCRGVAAPARPAVRAGLAAGGSPLILHFTQSPYCTCGSWVARGTRAVTSPAGSRDWQVRRSSGRRRPAAR